MPSTGVGALSGTKRDPWAGLTRRGLRLLLRGRRPPIFRGRIEVPGISGRVRVLRDRWGIPHVRAQSDADAWFGLGFCQAQDRSFQLTLLARVANGRLSEMIGPEGVAIDRLARRLGFAARAERLLAAQTQAISEQISAFARGVTQGVRRGRNKRAPAFVLVRSHPVEFTARDVVAIMQLQAFGLSANWDAELARLMVLTLDGPRALAAIDPRYSDTHPRAGGEPAPLEADRVAALERDIEALRQLVGVGPASNAWAIDGRRTATGRPLLANDPHLQPTLPSPWYLCHLQTPVWNAAGAAMVGLPAIASGHNGDAAWGVTAGMSDVCDLFVHEFDAERETMRVDGAWVPASTRQETIFVRGSAPVIERVHETKHGPLLTPALDVELDASDATVRRELSMLANWMLPGQIAGMLEMHRVSTFDAARAALARWPTMPLGVVWASCDDGIGYVLAGDVPEREQPPSLLPTDATRGASGWRGLIDGTRNPHVHGPSSGYVVTANNAPATAPDSPPLGHDWLEGHRAAAIEQALASQDAWDVTSAMRLQVDQRCVPWPELRAHILAAARRSEHPLAADAAERLRTWDGQVTADSVAATLYELWTSGMSRALAIALAPRSHDWILGRSAVPSARHSFLALRRISHLTMWLNGDLELPVSIETEHVATQAFGDMLRELVTQHGDDIAQWRWGELRPLTLRHPLGEVAPALASLFNLGPYPCGGDSHTVGQASVVPGAPLANPLAVASLRVVIDVGAPRRSRFCIAGGQSGNPLSKQYDTFMDLWLRGQGVPIAFDDADVENAAVHRLELIGTHDD